MTTTTSRLLQLLSLLQARRDCSGTALAERLGTTPRTVRRDIERLRQMGYGIRSAMGPDGGYRLEAGSELPPLLFDDEQALALALALQSEVGAGAGVEEAALRALSTVRQLLPHRLRHRLASMEFSSMRRPAHGPAVTADPEVLLALSTAVRAREVLRFDYAGSTPAPDALGRARRVEPHRLLTMDARWYLLAWDLELDAWRVFRADRVTPRAPTGRRFQPRPIPGDDARAFVSARFHGSPAHAGWPCIGTVVVHAPARAVLPFAGDGTVEELDAARCRYTVGSWSWIALAASLGRFDSAIDVVGPDALRDAFAQLAVRNAATAAGGQDPRSAGVDGPA